MKKDFTHRLTAVALSLSLWTTPYLVHAATAVPKHPTCAGAASYVVIDPGHCQCCLPQQSQQTASNARCGALCAGAAALLSLGQLPCAAGQLVLPSFQAASFSWLTGPEPLPPKYAVLA